MHALTYPLPEVAFAVRCLHGSGVDTDEAFFYDVERFTAGEVPPAPKDKAQGPGDGTVGLASLEACSRCQSLGFRGFRVFRDFRGCPRTRPRGPGMKQSAWLRWRRAPGADP